LAARQSRVNSPVTAALSSAAPGVEALTGAPQRGLALGDLGEQFVNARHDPSLLGQRRYGYTGFSKVVHGHAELPGRPAHIALGLMAKRMAHEAIP
jgi:hypothetical protein